eukprot:10115716-Heterocapsa_arctica.AAC.1
MMTLVTPPVAVGRGGVGRVVSRASWASVVEPPLLLLALLLALVPRGLPLVVGVQASHQGQRLHQDRGLSTANSKTCHLRRGRRTFTTSSIAMRRGRGLLLQDE